MPGLRRQDRRHQHRCAGLCHHRSLPPQLGALDVEWLIEHEALGKPGRGARAHGQPRRHIRHRSYQRVDPERRLGWLVDPPQERPGLRGPQLAPPQRHQPLRHRVHHRRLRGGLVREPVEQGPTVARRAAQDRVDQPGAARAVALGELDALVDRGVCRDAVQVGQLKQA